MQCGDRGSVTRVLVGLHEVGVVGLRETLREADRWEIDDRQEAVRRILEIVEPLNYVPDSQIEEFRRAVTREYLRRRGEDFRGWFSRLEVTVRGRPGKGRDRLVDRVASVLAEFELEPVVTLEPPPEEDEGPFPELRVLGEPVVRGIPERHALKEAIRKRISHW
jgi:hypothetical protein